MPFPSLHFATDNVRAWSVARAAAYGAGLGVVAALFKTLGPLREAASVGESFTERSAANLLEAASAALAFALICAAAACLRNFIARRFVWPDMR